MGNTLSVRAIREEDKAWMKKVMTESWGSEIVIASKSFNTLMLPGFIAELERKTVGVLTYDVAENKCEVVSINSTVEGKGIGTSLIDALKNFAKDKKLQCVWLVTSNDNIDALRFYQKRGFRITKIHRNAIAEARKIKPQIPLIGQYGIPMKDAIELELHLDA